MNERIKDLAEQALEYAEKNQSADIPQHWFRLYNEKFAELIVRECANISNQAEQQCQHPATQILKHFGVEE